VLISATMYLMCEDNAVTMVVARVVINICYQSLDKFYMIFKTC
jgi:hypothetical protein